jgi:hypothetical protein
MARLFGPSWRDKRFLDGGCGSAIAQDPLTLLYVLAEVEAHGTEGDLLISTTGIELLQNLKLDGAFGQAVVAVDGNAHWDDLGITVLDPMVQDRTFRGPPPVFSVYAVREIPLDQGYARYEWYIVEI